MYAALYHRQNHECSVHTCQNSREAENVCEQLRLNLVHNSRGPERRPMGRRTADGIRARQLRVVFFVEVDERHVILFQMKDTRLLRT